MKGIRRSIEDEAAQRVARAGSEIDVVDAYARPIAAHTATALFGIRGSDERTFMDVARAIFGHVFLNITDEEDIRQRALRAAVLMKVWFEDEIRRRRASGNLGIDMMGALMAAKTVDDDGVRRTLGGMLVGSIDTTASSVAKIIAMIAADGALAKHIAADVDDEARIAGWCREALRRWPHNPVVSRQAAAKTSLADKEIRRGDRIFAWTQAAMLDAEVFPEPQYLRPDRPAAAYLHFGAGLHPCAGRAVNAFQIPVLVSALVRRGIESTGTMQWAGPFPAHLPLRFDAVTIMSHALVTIIAPLALERLEEAEAAIDSLGNPARADVAAALDKHEDAEHGTHFASLHAFKSQDGKRAYIVFEFSADGPEDDALARIDRQIGEHLRRVFMLANDWSDRDLLAYMKTTPRGGGLWLVFQSRSGLFRHTRTDRRPHPARSQARRLCGPAARRPTS